MVRIKLLRGGFALVDDEDFEYLNQFKWYLTKNGYVATRKGMGNKTVLMHRLINKTPDGKVTDHINRNKLDNRRLNLRSATLRENAFNSGLYNHNTSGIKGVVWDKKKDKWRAQIQIDGHCKFLGNFILIDAALKARQKAEKQLWSQ